MCPHLVGPSGWVTKHTVEEAEERELEKQGFHLEVMGQAVQHLDQAVVSVGAVLSVAPKQQHIGSHDS